MGKAGGFASRAVRAVALGVWVGAVVWASLMRPGSRAARLIALGGGPTLGHCVAYAVLFLLSFWFLAGLQYRARLAWAAGASLGFGAAMEGVQPLFGRCASLSDVASNAAGVALAGLVLGLCRAMRSRGESGKARPDAEGS